MMIGGWSVALAISLGAVTPGSQTAGALAVDRAGSTHGTRAAGVWRISVRPPSLDGLRASARRPDDHGYAHYQLAVAIRDAAVLPTGVQREQTVEQLLREGVEAGEVAWARHPSSSMYATVLGDLHGQLASREGGVARVRHGRRAAALYARAVQLDPRNPLAHVGVGISKLKTPVLFGGSIARALDAFRRAQALDPRCAQAWTWEAIALRRRGQVRQARAALVHALTIDPGSRHARGELRALNQDFRE